MHRTETNTLDSVFLTCACDIYKSSILDVMSTVSCLIPGLDFGMNAQPDHPYPDMPVSSGMRLDTTISSTMYPPPVSAIFTPRTPSGGQSDMFSIFNEELFGLIKNISSRIGEEVFDKLCDGLPALQKCVSSGYKDSTKDVDVILSKFLNLDNLEQALASICKIKSEIFDNFDCIVDASFPMSACVLMSMSGLSLNSAQPGIMSGELDALCPLVGDASRCMAIQAKTCSNRLATEIQSLVPDLLSPTCSSLAKNGANNPYMATPMICALPTLHTSLSVISTIGPSQPTSGETGTVINSMIDVYCGELADILTCIHEEIPTSMNTIDTFIRSIIDVNQFAYSKTVASYICKESRVQAIKDMIPCVLNNTFDVSVCVSPFNSLGFNLTTIGRNETADRTTYCGPIKNVSSCAVDSILAPCSPDVATFARDIFQTLLRTDCNGVRNGNLQGVINAQRQENTATTNQRPLPVITVLVFLFFLLL
ncbi:uncharacterized protein LOC117325823 isoform X2 [Pecten maximus]|uniref:uncharacterized protein LOC117325823 isoform X2 n=1 Tax=Pecten maximus TaxID=6579 RepID=UPI001458A2F2|nr:uncharacterized protein LOC117325823 isoform X2 [Pecten maximus]